MTLANKYRPTEFSDVIGQTVNTTVLENQIANKSFAHTQLFAGSSGCGKTTCARIFANKIDGEIIELDCASHNGVADIKEIVDNARTKPLLNTYKVIILDECHAISQQAWSSLLTVLEEDLPSAIFVFCTTDPQKIPNTILSRAQRLNFVPISNKDMLNRLNQIAKIEHIDISENALKYIVISAKGNLRQALTNFDKCLMYDDLKPESVCKVLNIVSADIMNDLYTAFNNSDHKKIIELINAVYNNGYELHQFIRQFLDFCVTKSNMDLLNRLLTILQDIRYDEAPKNIIIARLIV